MILFFQAPAMILIIFSSRRYIQFLSEEFMIVQMQLDASVMCYFPCYLTILS